MLTITKKFTSTNDYSDIELVFKYDFLSFKFDSSELCGIDPESWVNLIHNGGKLDLADSYGSHCDNGEVTITSDKKTITLCIDTATGGSVELTIDINENVIDEFDKLTEWCKQLPIDR
jgi:hypothetical protein